MRFRALVERPGLMPDRRQPGAAILPCHVTRLAFDGLDADAAFAVSVAASSALQSGRELARRSPGDFEQGLVRGDADRADLALGDMAAATQQRQEPARIGIVPAADVHAEPDRVLEAGTGSVRAEAWCVGV